MTINLVSVTPDAEKTMAHIARVSNPDNQDNPNYSGLLKYCIKHNHWSVFEQSTMTLEIETTRAIAAQILRHRSLRSKNFPNDMQRVINWVRLNYQNCVDKTQRIVRIV